MGGVVSTIVLIANAVSSIFAARKQAKIEATKREEINRMNRELLKQAEEEKAKAKEENAEIDRKTVAAKKEAERLKEAIKRAVKQKEEIEAARQAMLEKDWGPRPSYIKETDYTVGFTGRTGVGKTSLWNAFVRLLFGVLLSTEQQAIHQASVPFGKVGAVETTTQTLPYRFPGTSFIVSDIPGHSTLSFQTQNYVRDFSIGYYDVIFYTYSSRLVESDVGLLLNFIMYDINFRLLRQKFRQDLVSFAENEFREHNNVGLFDDRDDEMEDYVQNRINDAEFIREVKVLLHKEVVQNWTKLLDGTGSDVVRRRRAEFVQKISDINIFYCVDSKYPKLYDTNGMLLDIKAGMDARKHQCDANPVSQECL